MNPEAYRIPNKNPKTLIRRLYQGLEKASVTTPQADREAAQQKLGDADQDRLEALGD